MSKPTALRVTFKHQVTKAELLKSLDQILNFYGCPACGLNGYGVYIGGDPYPEFGKFASKLAQEIPGIEVQGLANIAEGIR